MPGPAPQAGVLEQAQGLRPAEPATMLSSTLEAHSHHLLCLKYFRLVPLVGLGMLRKCRPSPKLART